MPTPRAVDCIVVPYDSARRGWRMGVGPHALLTALTADMNVIDVELSDDASSDVHGATIQLARATSECVRNAYRMHRFPLVLTGNCFMTVGALAACDDDVAVVWLDAHGDLNTPATSASGFLDGMSAAALLGWWDAGVRARTLPPARFLLVGARDLDAPEAEAIAQHGVRVLRPGDVATQLHSALDHACAGVSAAWLHLDLDVLDPAGVGRANAFAVDGGLSADDIARVVREIRARCPLAGLTVSAYDPAVDTDGRARAVAAALIADLLRYELASGTVIRFRDVAFGP